MGSGPAFTIRFARYGLFCGVLSMVDFICVALRFANFRIFGNFAFLISLILGVIIFPIWLLCLARQLPKATEKYESAARREALQISGLSSIMETAREAPECVDGIMS